MRISRDSWNIIQRVIRRYPDTKRRYQDALDAGMQTIYGSVIDDYRM